MDCDYEDKYVLKYGALEQEFEDLQVDTAEVAALLQQAKENKLRLQAEVKFLKKRAMMLRASMRLNEPYFMRNSVGDGTQYMLGSARAPMGRMVSDGELYGKAFSMQSMNPYSRGPSSTIPSFKPQDVVGVLKTSSSKQTPNGNNAPSKKSGKRKISWQDEFAVKA